MTLFDDLLYLNLGIALAAPASLDNMAHNQMDYVQYYVEAPYSQDSSQLHITAYSIKKDMVILPKRDFRSLYTSIAQSQWFSKSYKGRSLGDFIEIDY